MRGSARAPYRQDGYFCGATVGTWECYRLLQRASCSYRVAASSARFPTFEKITEIWEAAGGKVAATVTVMNPANKPYSIMSCPCVSRQILARRRSFQRVLICSTLLAALLGIAMIRCEPCLHVWNIGALIEARKIQ